MSKIDTRYNPILHAFAFWTNQLHIRICSIKFFLCSHIADKRNMGSRQWTPSCFDLFGSGTLPPSNVNKHTAESCVGDQTCLFRDGLDLMDLPGGGDDLPRVGAGLWACRHRRSSPPSSSHPFSGCPARWLWPRNSVSGSRSCFEEGHHSRHSGHTGHPHHRRFRHTSPTGLNFNPILLALNQGSV